MTNVRRCHLRIASVNMIDQSPKRGRLKFTALELNLHYAFPQVRDSAGDDCDPAGVQLCLTGGLLVSCLVGALGRAVSIVV